MACLTHDKYRKNGVETFNSREYRTILIVGMAGRFCSNKLFYTPAIVFLIFSPVVSDMSSALKFAKRYSARVLVCTWDSIFLLTSYFVYRCTRSDTRMTVLHFTVNRRWPLSSRESVTFSVWFLHLRAITVAKRAHLFIKTPRQKETARESFYDDRHEHE